MTNEELAQETLAQITQNPSTEAQIAKAGVYALLELATALRQLAASQYNRR